MKILILCSDNSCLSQMAQGWLQSFDKSLTVCSAGISPAIEVHPLAVQTLASSGIDISHHKPEAVEEYKTWQRKLGRDINPTELIMRIRQAGAKRVRVSSPLDITISETQIPACTETTVIYGGIEDD